MPKMSTAEIYLELQGSFASLNPIIPNYNGHTPSVKKYIHHEILGRKKLYQRMLSLVYKSINKRRQFVFVSVCLSVCAILRVCTFVCLCACV